MPRPAPSTDAGHPRSGGFLRPTRAAAERKAFIAEERSAIVRLLVIAFNVSTYWGWLHPQGLGDPALAAFVTVAAMVYGLYDLVFQPYLRFPIMATAAWTAVTDGVLITLWLHATGDFASPYYVLWYLSLVAVAFRFDWRASLVAALLYSVAYIALLGATGPLQDHAVEAAIRVAYILLCGALGAILAYESMQVLERDVVLGERVASVQRRGKALETMALLREHEVSARLAAVVASSIDGILSKDLTGRITSWNPACETLFGYSAKEMLGKSITMLYPKGQEGEEEKLLQRIRAGQPVRIREAERVRKDGSRFWVSVSASPLRDANGTIVGAVAIKRDVTDARLAEKERQEAKARFQEFKRLQELSLFKTRFINTAAHELRTPLLPLRMQLELLMTDEEHPPLPSQVESMEVMRRNLDRLGALVEDLLTAARSQAGRIQLDVKPTDLAEVLREAEQTFRTMAQRRAIDLTVDAKPMPPLLADGKRIGQVVTNLVSNAFKFTPGGGRIGLTLRPEGDGARITVSDTGGGIPPADVERLFQPFVQVHDAAQVTQPGSGLGLYICRQLVELHGGRIGCESSGRGKGATFWFTLPGIPFRPVSDDTSEWTPS